MSDVDSRDSDHSEIDWSEIERAATAQVIAAVRSVREQHPHETVYGAMFHEFYGDGSVIYWPMLTVGTEESLAKAVAGYIEVHGDEDGLETELRWSGADLAHSFDPNEKEQELAARVQFEASSDGTFEDWEAVYDRYLRCFPRAAMRAREELVGDGVVGDEFIAMSTAE